MSVKALKYILPLLLLPVIVAPVALSCNKPPYFDNVKHVFPAVVRVVAGDRMGSGVIITAEGYIVTSQHVVNENKTVFVLLNNGSVYEAPVSGTDEATDLAFIKLPAVEGGYAFALMGDSTESDELQTGSPLIVLGYPVDNDLDNLMLSTGIVCAFRKIESVRYIQSDATIYAGSSGGPMLNNKGDVIGIINSKYANIQDSCATFATAVNEAKELFSRVEKGQPIGKQQLEEQEKPDITVVISDVRISEITENSALISWGTNLPASSGIEIGKIDLSHFYPSSEGNPVIEHSVQVTGLEARTSYHFRVTAGVEPDTRAVSSIYEFETSREACSSVGCNAPSFSLNTIDGQAISLSKYRGRKVILVFTSVRCSSCAEVMRCIQQIYDNWPRQQMEVITIVCQEKVSEVERWIKLYGIKTPVVLDPAGEVTNRYQPSKMPALYFLDSGGIIKIKKYAPLGDCGKEIDALLRLY